MESYSPHKIQTDKESHFIERQSNVYIFLLCIIRVVCMKKSRVKYNRQGINAKCACKRKIEIKIQNKKRKEKNEIFRIEE